MTVTKMNLVVAHKYLEKLKNAIKTPKNAKYSWNQTATLPAPLNPDTYTMGISTFHSSYDDDSSPSDYLQKLVYDKSVVQFEDYLRIIKDVKMFKTLIYDANAREGVSTVLSLLDFLNEEKKILTTFKERLSKSDIMSSCSIDKFDKTYHKYVDFVNSSDKVATNPYANITISLFYDVKTIDKRILELNQKITENENVRDRLNVSSEIQYDFSQASLKLLGLPLD